VDYWAGTLYLRLDVYQMPCLLVKSIYISFIYLCTKVIRNDTLKAQRLLYTHVGPSLVYMVEFSSVGV